MNERKKIDRLIGCLEETGILPGLTEILSEGEECWLVGGALRDTLLERTPYDFDIATPTDPTPLAKAFARSRNWTWFFLDEKRRQSRAVGEVEGKRISIDFAPLRATDLEGDLRLRDFTCNALALPLRRDGIGDLLDPLEGRRDIRGRILRICSDPVLEDDPLRILKGVRHAVVFGFDFDPVSAAKMLSAAPLIRNIAPERIRDELLKILSSDQLLKGISLINDFKLFPSLFHSHAPSEISVCVQRLESLLNIEKRLRDDLGPEVFDQIIEEGLMAYALPRLYCFLRAGSSENPSQSGERLRLSRRTLRGLRSLEIIDKDPQCDPPPTEATLRSHALWLSRLGSEPIGTALFLASFKGVDTSIVARALRATRQLSRDGRIPDLIDGNRIGELLKIPPGPGVGELLDVLRLAEIRGEVTNPSEGEAYLRKWLKRD